MAMPEANNEIPFLEIYYDAHSDDFIGLNAKAYVLYINNKSSQHLKNVKITIDHQFSAELSKLDHCPNDYEGCKKYNKNDIKPNETLSFIFSHDVTNYGVFRDDNNKPYGFERLISSIKIESMQGTGKWKFVRDMNRK